MAANSRACSTGTTVSLVPCSTKNGGASGPTWLIGDACPPLAVLGEGRLEHLLGQQAAQRLAGRAVAVVKS